MHVGLSHFENEPFAEGSTERNLVQEAAIYARDGNRSTLRARLNDVPQNGRPVERHLEPLLGIIVCGSDSCSVCFQTNSIDTSIRAAARSHPLQFFDEIIHFFVVDDLRAGGSRHLQTFRNAIDCNYTFSSQQQRAPNRELAYRTTTPNRNYI